MTESAHLPIEEMSFFRALEDASDELFELVAKWTIFNQDTVGKQLVKAYDSAGANLVEGDGRHTQPDALRFFIMSRASGREARFWLRRAKRRGLLKPDVAIRFDLEMERSLKATNKIIAYRRSSAKPNVVREMRSGYGQILTEIEDDS